LDEELLCGGRVREAEGFAQQVFGFVEQSGVLDEESDERVTALEVIAEFGVHLDAGVSAYGIAGVEAAAAETLNGPADLLAVHAAEVAGLRRREGALGDGDVM